MTTIDMKPSPPHSIPPSSSLKRSYDDAQRTWHQHQQHAYHPPTPPSHSHASPYPGGSDEHGDEPISDYMNEDGSRKVVKKRKLEGLRRSSTVDEEMAQRKYQMSSSAYLPPTPHPEHHEVKDYARINNILHTAHVLRHHASPAASPAASTSASASWSPPERPAAASRAPAAVSDKAKDSYGETNRILGMLALERSRRHGIQQAAQNDSDDDDDEGGGGGQEGSTKLDDEEDGSVETDDPSVIYDSDMEL